MLGQPEKIVNLGAKQIFVYKDLKVTFINGKVVDVQQGLPFSGLNEVNDDYQVL
jgi:hypothetical protein